MPRPVAALLRLALAGLAVLVLTMAGVVLHAAWIAEVPHKLAPADVIVVLGGSLRPDGTIARDTESRARAGAALYNRGLAPRIHFTGGIAPEGQALGPGEQMRRLAVSLGVPEAATSAENLSQSTLQNALMSEPMLGPLVKQRIILVSDGYHLGRSWATFRWAGYSGPIQLYAESSLGPMPRTAQAWRILREALAWYFNPARLLLWYGAGLAGVPDDTRMQLLD